MDAADTQDIIARLDSVQFLERIRGIVDRNAVRVAGTRCLVARTAVVLRRQQRGWAGDVDQAGAADRAGAP